MSEPGSLPTLLNYNEKLQLFSARPLPCTHRRTRTQTRTHTQGSAIANPLSAPEAKLKSHYGKVWGFPLFPLALPARHLPGEAAPPSSEARSEAASPAGVRARCPGSAGSGYGAMLARGTERCWSLVRRNARPWYGALSPAPSQRNVQLREFPSLCSFSSRK